MIFPDGKLSVSLLISIGCYNISTTVFTRAIELVHKHKCEPAVVVCIMIFFLSHRIAVTVMAGRAPNWSRGLNLSRSQSLLNMRSGYEIAPVEDQFGNFSRSHTAVPTSSEEEGLELLGSAATSEDFDPVSSHGEIDTPVGL
jgi:hypothetical protein